MKARLHDVSRLPEKVSGGMQITSPLDAGRRRCGVITIAIRTCCAVLLAASFAACAAQKSEVAPNSRAPAAGGGRTAPFDPREPLWTRVPNSRGVIATLGDTITLGIGSSTAEKTYPADLARLTGMNVVNLGRRNAMTDDVTAHEVPLIPAEAAAVVIDIGTIDASAAATDAEPGAAVRNAKIFEPHVDRMLSAVRRQAPGARIVIVTVRDMGRAGSGGKRYRRDSLTAAVHEWDEHLKVAAAEPAVHAAIVDTETDAAWYVAADYEASGVHPSNSGAKRLAEAVAAALR